MHWHPSTIGMLMVSVSVVLVVVFSFSFQTLGGQLPQLEGPAAFGPGTCATKESCHVGHPRP